MLTGLLRGLGFIISCEVEKSIISFLALFPWDSRYNITVILFYYSCTMCQLFTHKTIIHSWPPLPPFFSLIVKPYPSSLSTITSSYKYSITYVLHQLQSILYNNKINTNTVYKYDVICKLIFLRNSMYEFKSHLENHQRDTILIKYKFNSYIRNWHYSLI